MEVVVKVLGKESRHLLGKVEEQHALGTIGRASHIVHAEHFIGTIEEPSSESSSEPSLLPSSI